MTPASAIRFATAGAFMGVTIGVSLPWRLDQRVHHPLHPEMPAEYVGPSGIESGGVVLLLLAMVGFALSFNSSRRAAIWRLVSAFLLLPSVAIVHFAAADCMSPTGCRYAVGVGYRVTLAASLAAAVLSLVSLFAERRPARDDLEPP